MPRGIAKQDTETLSMALIGFERKKEEIDEKIRHIKGLLGGNAAGGNTQGVAKKGAAKKSAGTKSSAAVSEADVPRKRKKLSAAARKRIGIAQRRRWAEHRKSLEASAK